MQASPRGPNWFTNFAKMKMSDKRKFELVAPKSREIGPHVLGVKICVTKSWPVTAPGSQGVFRGRGRGFGFLKNGRQAAIVLSWLLLVQLPGQVLRSYSSKVSKSKRFLIVKQILVYSVTAKLSTEQYLVVRYWFTRMR
jgi:hypothetical protein